MDDQFPVRLSDESISRFHRRYAKRRKAAAGFIVLHTSQCQGTAPIRLQERLEVIARRQLLFSDESAGQVAASLGFRDASYFARFFRRRTGVSPARFRESGRQPSTRST